MDQQMLEDSQARAWPCFSEHEVAGWRLRYAEGYTRRSNSASIRGQPGADMAASLRSCTEAFQRLGIAPCFKILGPMGESSAELGGLNALADRTLAEAGYVISARSVVECIDLDGRGPAMGAPGAAGDFPLSVSPVLSEEWARDGAALRDHAAEADIYHRILSRIASPAFYIRAGTEGRPLGVAMCVLDDVARSDAALRDAALRDAARRDAGGEVGGTGMVGPRFGWIFGVIVGEAARRRGVARAMMDRLANEATAAGATMLCLQVEAENVPARSLYEGMGFRPLYEYWYRVSK